MVVWPWFLVLIVLALAWILMRWFLGSRVSPRAILLLGVPVLALLALGDVLDRGGSLFLSSRGTETVDLSAELFSLEGRPVAVDEYKGSVVFLNFWATWCGPCRMEMPSMANLYKHYSDKGLVMLAVSDEEPETVRTFLERDPYPFPVLLDTERTLFSRFRVSALPTTMVIDREGKLVMEHTGGYQWDTPEVLEKFRGFLEK